MKVPTIKAKGFILRPYKKSDRASLLKHLNNEMVSRYMSSIPYPYKVKDAVYWENKVLKAYKSRKLVLSYFVIDVSGELVGAVNLDKKESHFAELGYWLSEEHWGRGIMTEAVKRSSYFGFNQIKLIRIFAKVFPENKGSMRVLEKSGFRFEGVLKKGSVKNGRYIDSSLFAKTK